MTEDEIRDLLKKIEDAPEMSDEDADLINKWGSAFASFLEDAEKDIGMGGVMMLLSKAFVTMAVLHGVPLDRLQVGVALSYTLIKQTLDEEDNLTSSHNVH